MSASFNLKMAASVCNQGGVIAYPTESVFGLGCNPDDLTAVEKLLALKNRPVEKGLILIAAHIEQLQPYIIASNTAMQRISSQTQPTTWLVKTSSYTPAWITGQHNKVAVRITQHPVARHLCAQLNYPLVSTSANPGGKPPARSGLQARIYFAHTVDYYVAGKVGALKNPTQIIDMETGKIIRTG